MAKIWGKPSNMVQVQNYYCSYQNSLLTILRSCCKIIGIIPNILHDFQKKFKSYTFQNYKIFVPWKKVQNLCHFFAIRIFILLMDFWRRFSLVYKSQTMRKICKKKRNMCTEWPVLVKIAQRLWYCSKIVIIMSLEVFLQEFDKAQKN